MVPYDLLVDFLRSCNEKLSCVDSQLVRYGMYDMNYGIENLPSNTVKNPFSRVAFYDAEETIDDKRLEDLVNRFADNMVGDILKIDFFDYLSLPSDVSVSLDNILEKRVLKRKKEMEELEAAAKGKKK